MFVLARALAALPDLAFGLAWLAAWAAPSRVGAGAVSSMILIIELEAVALLGAYLTAMGLAIILDPTEQLRNRLLGALIPIGMIGFAAMERRDDGTGDRHHGDRHHLLRRHPHAG